MPNVIKHVKNRATIATDIFYDSVHALIESDATCSAFERALVTTFFAKFLSRVANYNTLENTCIFSIEKLVSDQTSGFGYNSVTKSDSLFDTASAAEGASGYRIKVVVDGVIKENHVLNVSVNMGKLLFKDVDTKPYEYELEKGFEWDFLPKEERSDSVTDNDEIGQGSGTKVVPADVSIEEAPVSTPITTARIISTPTPTTK